MSIFVSVFKVLITSKKAALDVGTTCQATVPASHILPVCVLMLIVRHVISNLQSLPGKDPAV